MRRIICDKCLREDLAPLRPERFSVEVKLPSETLQIDLCDRCAARLKTWCRESDPQAGPA